MSGISEPYPSYHTRQQLCTLRPWHCLIAGKHAWCLPPCRIVSYRLFFAGSYVPEVEYYLTAFPNASLLRSYQPSSNSGIAIVKGAVAVQNVPALFRSSSGWVSAELSSTTISLWTTTAAPSNERTATQGISGNARPADAVPSIPKLTKLMSPDASDVMRDPITAAQTTIASHSEAVFKPASPSPSSTEPVDGSAASFEVLSAIFSVVSAVSGALVAGSPGASYSLQRVHTTSMATPSDLTEASGVSGLTAIVQDPSGDTALAESPGSKGSLAAADTARSSVVVASGTDAPRSSNTAASLATIMQTSTSGQPGYTGLSKGPSPTLLSKSVMSSGLLQSVESDSNSTTVSQGLGGYIMSGLGSVGNTSLEPTSISSSTRSVAPHATSQMGESFHLAPHVMLWALLGTLGGLLL